MSNLLASQTGISTAIPVGSDGSYNVAMQPFIKGDQQIVSGPSAVNPHPLSLPPQYPPGSPAAIQQAAAQAASSTSKAGANPLLSGNLWLYLIGAYLLCDYFFGWFIFGKKRRGGKL